MNTGVITFLLVIFGSISLGVATGAIAHKMGNDSLAGITSPQENPSQQYIDPGNDNPNQQFTLINEQDILTEVNNIRQRHKDSRN